MNLKILLPFGILCDKKNVIRIVADSHEGSFGILPRRLDCVTALVPGVLTYQIESEDETYVALDEGVLIKTGLDVSISVRNAVSGTDLSKLRQLVEDQFVQHTEQEENVRSVLTKMESNILRRLSEFRHE